MRKVCQSYTSEEIFVRRKKNFPSLYQCIDNLGPVISVRKQISHWSIAAIKPSHWSLASDHGTHLRVLLPLPQLGSVATSLSNSNIWQKIEIKQIIAGFVEPESFPTNDNLIQSENNTS